MSTRFCDIFIETGIIFLLIFTPMALGTVQQWAIFIMRATVILLLGIWLLKIALQGRFTFKHTSLDIPLLIFLGVTLISTLWISNYKRISWEVFSYFATSIILFFIITNNITEESQIKRIITALILVNFIIGVYGILQFFNIASLTPRVTPLRISSTYYNSNHYAGYLVMVLPVSIGLFLYTMSIWKTLGLGILVIILGINLALSYSWGEVAFLIALIFLLSLSLWALEKKIVIIKTAVIGIVIVLISLGGMFLKGPQLPQGYLSQRFDALLNLSYESIVGRIGTYKYTLKIVFDHPLLGTGPGTFPDVFPRYRPVQGWHAFINYAHNDYLQIASEIGIIGLVSFFIVIITLLSQGFSAISSSKDWIKALYIGILSGLLGILFHGIFDGNLTIIPANIIHFYLLSAILSIRPE